MIFETLSLEWYIGNIAFMLIFALLAAASSNIHNAIAKVIFSPITSIVLLPLASLALNSKIT